MAGLKVTKQHKCFTKVNQQLRPYNAELETDLFNGDRVFIVTYRIDANKRGRLKKMVASFCPFCGKKLNAD